MRLAAIRHSNIVAIYDMGMDGGVPFIVMEYIQGETIGDIVKRNVFDLAAFMELARQCLDGLMAAHHAGLVHRDIKPANIMLALLPSGAFHVKILDFGIATFQAEASSPKLNKDGTVTGSIHCISPEQLSVEPVDVRSDLYSLGCVLYFALSGRYPFEGTTTPDVIAAHLDGNPVAISLYRPDLPDLVCQWVMVLLNRQPIARYQNGAQALAALETTSAQSDTGSEAKPLNEIDVQKHTQPGLSPVRKRRPPLLMLGVIILLALSACGIFWNQFGRNPSKRDTGIPSLVSAPVIAVDPQLSEEHRQPQAGASQAPEMSVKAQREAEQGDQLTAKIAAVTPTLTAAAIASLAEQPAAPVPVVAAVVPVLFRINGSNTMGAKLIPAMVDKFLQKIGATGIEHKPSKNPLEQVISARFPDIGLAGIEISAHGSTTAFEGLISQRCEIGMSSRPIKPEEVKACMMAGLGEMQSTQCEHVLGLDGVAILVNPNNPLTELSREEIAGIFSGNITDWAAVGGTPGPIEIAARDDKSGTFDTFKSIVLGGASLAPHVQRFEDSAALSARVSNNVGTIGFAGLAFIGDAKVLAVSEAGASAFFATRFTVATEDYLLSRRLFLYTPECPPTTWVNRLIEFALSAEGQEIVSSSGFVKQTIDLHRPMIPADALAEYVRTVNNAERLSLNCRFRFGSMELDSKAVRDLDRIALLIREPRFKGRDLMLLGFSDGLGANAGNLKMSKTRATVVAQHLIARGVNPRVVSGFGATSPVASNETQQGRDKNRRVEIWLR